MPMKVFPAIFTKPYFLPGKSREKIRYLIESTGYVEGWATYIESYAYQYAASYLDDPAAADVTALSWLNRSVNLCLYSLIDIGIHYYGWNETRTASFLEAFWHSGQCCGKRDLPVYCRNSGKLSKILLGDI